MRGEVLRCYRLLQRACRNLFQNDHEALKAAQVRVKEEFWKNRSVTDQEQISQLVGKAREAEQFIRTNVVQAVNTGSNTFRVRMTPDTVLENNAPLPKSPDTTLKDNDPLPKNSDTPLENNAHLPKNSVTYPKQS